MELLTALVADAANEAEGKKLNVLGIFHVIGAAQFPVAHPHLALALEFRAQPYDKGKTFLNDIFLRDPDGKEIFHLQGNLEISGAHPSLTPIIPVAFNIHNLVFPVEGNYRFEILVNNSQIGEVALEIVRLSPPQNQPS